MTARSKIAEWLDREPHPVQSWDVPMIDLGEEEVTESYEPASLAEMQKRVYDTNVANGWFDEGRSFGDDIALLHSEVSEAFEAYRDHGLEDVTDWPKTPDSLVYEVGHPDKARELFIEHQKAEGKLPKPQGVGSELADVLVRLLDTAHRTETDLEFEFNRKMNYNATRGYRHGGKRV